MSDQKEQATARTFPKLSLDTWAVLLALAAAALVRLGWIPHVRW